MALKFPGRWSRADRKENDKTMQANRKHDAEHAAMAAAHERHGGGKTSGGHGGRHAGHDKHAGHATGMFRDRFWISLVLSVPVVLYSEMLQNLFWAAGYNVVAIPLAAGVLAPLGILLSPAVGAVLMSLSTIIVALNAQLLRRLDLRPSRA